MKKELVWAIVIIILVVVSTVTKNSEMVVAIVEIVANIYYLINSVSVEIVEINFTEIAD